MVDIIIPAYNSSSYIKEALDSAINQTYQDFCIIVVDDGSTDFTRKIVEQYVKNYPKKIKYFYQKNNGPASARNRGIQEAQGKYIAFLDSDDIWMPDKLEKQVMSLDKNQKAGFVYCDNYFIGEDGRGIEDYARKIKMMRGNILLDLFLDFFIMIQGVMLRKECIGSTGLFEKNLRVGEDYEFLLRLARNYQAEVIEEKLWKRRVVKNSLSRENYILDANNDLNTLTIFIKRNPDFYRMNKKKISTRLAGYNFSFAYRLLEEGENTSAFFHFVRSLTYRVSAKAIKNIFFCGVPYKLRRYLKDLACRKLA